MKIKHLQKLEFLLQTINLDGNSRKYEIKFGMNGKVYTGSFLPSEVQGEFQHKHFYFEAKNTNNISSNNFENASNLFENFSVKSKIINVADQDAFKKIFFAQNNEEDSTYMNLVNTSKHFDSFNYFLLLQSTLKQYNFEFSEELPPLIYRVFGPNEKEKYSFMYVNKDTEFDFVTLV